MLSSFPVDILENNESWRLVADLPGVTQQDLQVQLEGDQLSIGAADEVQRLFRLPETIDPEAIEAHLADGVLQITLPKGGSRRRQIPIATA